ncbi:metabolite traffic protein EboE [Fibrella aquatilis]|uniref:Metabolite traffic protein EboE n=1 Tax=Fibrella aquatilis TaxID=2817059 RepID=A0A939G3S1_9BACT|nr:metabolite traffic protein EboE [Fibrella aquatilis]MBO0930560.1 metabolite traffic protein EboE [Fibrella aquatilis]
MILGYCTNIHPGEAWDDHFKHLREQVPAVKAAVSPDKPLALGLRLANLASVDLMQPKRMSEFKAWLAETGCYIFTMNGFPYGGFHHERVKDDVHSPDWTTADRVDYTIRLFRLLTELLPTDETEGGISTSPLSYRLWWPTPAARQEAMQTATEAMLTVVDELIRLRQTTGKIMHLDVEPEPDGLLDNCADFVAWYTTVLRPAAQTYLAEKHGFTKQEVDGALYDHVQLCYDVCHVAVAYEEIDTVLASLATANIRVGKVQISSALQIDFTDDAAEKLAAIGAFNEPTYLHQVVARLTDGTLTHFADLPDALAAYDAATHREWRIHFHVPLFMERYGLLGSTQASVVEALHRQHTTPFTNHLEIETYTWGVLPPDLQAPISKSISREIAWVGGILKHN